MKIIRSTTAPTAVFRPIFLLLFISITIPESALCYQPTDEKRDVTQHARHDAIFPITGGRQDGVRVFQSKQEAVEVIQRNNTCTLVLLGAHWDGHFKNFLTTRGIVQESLDGESLWSMSMRHNLRESKIKEVFLGGGTADDHFERNFWQRVAYDLHHTSTYPFEVAFLEYDGSLEGPMSIPSELLSQPTLPSFGWYAYRDGVLMHLESHNRPCLSSQTSKYTSPIDAKCFEHICYPSRHHSALSEEL